MVQSSTPSSPPSLLSQARARLERPAQLTDSRYRAPDLDRVAIILAGCAV